MEVEVLFKKENPLMDRLEVDFKVTHPKEVTPKRKDVRNEIATLLKVQKDRIVIDHMKSEFGKPETLGYAKVYKSKSEALSKETDAVLKRNSLVEGGKDKSEEKKEKAEEKKEKAEEKKETAEGKEEEE